MSTPALSNHRRLAGALYVMVLGTAMLVTVIGLSALMAVRVQHRGVEGTNDLVGARRYAQAGIELGMQWIENDPSWRTARGEGLWAIDTPIAEGRFSLEANDLGANSNLAASADTDAVLLTGIGEKGEARFKLQVTLTPETKGLTCLEVALHAGNDIIFDGATVNGSQIVSANDMVDATGATVSPAVEAVNAIVGGTLLGGTTSGITPRTMPDPVTVFDYYLANGTAIPFASLPTQGTTRLVTEVLLSPNSNPYGSTNAEGIYVIDCQGIPISIKACRIVGTLVLLNCPVGSSVKTSVNLTPAVPNYPVLLVQGEIDFVFNTAALNEGPTGVNFNPPGTPDESGITDLDTSDSYPSEIAGLVYGNNDLTSFVNYPTFRGCVVTANTLTISSSNFNVEYDGTYLADPPPGFRESPKIVISPGSWRQVVD